MRLAFHGADQGVTGSCHLIEQGGTRILVDCGLFQGSRELDEDNAGDFGFDPASIDYVLLTHAHLDHCGRLPLLARRGFRGEIVTTSASRELARVVMLDAARLQEEEARRSLRRALRRGRENHEEPLYGTADAFQAMEMFGRTADYGRGMVLTDDISVTFLDAGHILGSANIVVDCGRGATRRRVLFSGDIGSGGRPLLKEPARPPACDAVVMETTYGDRLHRALEPSIEELYAAIADTHARGGNVIIPTFALERAQEILFYLREGMDSGRVPRRMRVFLDSPMAISATQIFSRHPECHGPILSSLIAMGRDPFRVPGLHFVRETADSMALNQIASGAIIMAGSGMCTGGRVRHHLKHNLWREESSVIFVGYAAQGTLARRIIDGAPSVNVLGEEIRVRARIHTINGFSAHADRDELLAWQAQAAPDRTFLVHGEENAMRAFASRLRSTRVSMPARGEYVDL
ncbi:MAG: MBL fold metallo-hydrolase RNA specificity domain-containing protein [Gammaproteobacteria bacterium]